MQGRITFNATGGGSEFLFYLDDNPIGVKSGSSVLTTSTLITGNRIKVESFNAIGCSSLSDEIFVQIVDNPIISLTSTAFASSASSSTFCEGESITFNVTSTSAISTYTFSIGGTTCSWLQLPIILYTYTSCTCLLLHLYLFCRDSFRMYGYGDTGHVFK